MPLTPHLGAARMLREGSLGTFSRSRKPLVAAGLSLAMALTGLAVPTPAAAFMSTGTSTWVWQNPLPQGNPLSAVSCVDVSHCVLVGESGTTLATSTAGTTWVSGASRTSINLTGVSCPTATICFSVGDVGVILRSSDGGAGWSSQVSGTTKALYGISCPSSTACFAVGASGTIQATGDGGASWSAQVSGFPSTAINAISCGAANVCVAVGPGIAIYTTDGGVTWKSGALPPVTLNGVSCPSTSICFAVGEQATALKTADGGATWAQLNPNVMQNGFSSISCASTTTCLAHESGGMVGTTDGGTTWTTRGSFNAWAVSCPSVTTCYTAGLYGAIATTSDSGASWSWLSYTVTTEPLIRVKCPTPNTCFAVGNEGFYHRNGGPYPAVILGTTDGGRTWRTRYETSAGGLSDISCPSATTCFLTVGDSILSTSDGGSTWSQKSLGATTYGVGGIDCPTTTVCFAVGSMQDSTAALVYTTDGWATWTLRASAGPQYLTRISCAGIHNCVAVGYAGSTLRTWDGVNWYPGTAPTVPTQQLWAVDCPSATACFAVANGYPNQIFGTTDGGANWVAQSTPSTNFLWDVDCSTPTSCLAAGRGAILGTSDGVTWSPRNGGTNNDLVGIDCPAPTVCVAVGYAGTIIALPPGPLPPWWTLPAQASGVSRPPGPWYVQGAAPAPASPSTPHAALRLNQPRVPPSPGRSLMSAAMQAEITRALGAMTQQISRALQAIVS